jgi:pilus assembly protein CpaF
LSLKDRLNIKNEKKDIYSNQSNILNSMPLSEEFADLKDKIHNLLIEKVSSTPKWSTYSDDKQKELIAEFVEEQIYTNFSAIPLNKLEKERLIKEVIQETKGFGPLDTLLEDPGVSDILVNGPKNVYVEKNGKLYRTNIEFKDNEHLRSIIERIVSKVGRRIDEKSPMVDARLPDGSRVNAIIPPLSIDGPSFQ